MTLFKAPAVRCASTHTTRCSAAAVGAIAGAVPVVSGAIVYCDPLLHVRLKPAKGSQEPRFAVIPLGWALRRFVTLPADCGYAFDAKFNDPR